MRDSNLMPFSTSFWFDRSFVITVMGLLSASLWISAPAHAERLSPVQTLHESNLHESKPLLPNWVSQAPASQTTTWQSFSSIDGHYVVDLPASPNQFTSTTQVPEATLTWQVAEARQSGSSDINSYEYYMIAYTTLSADYLNNHNPEELVQEVSDAVLTEGGLTNSVQLQEAILFHNFPARMVIGSANDQYWVMIVSLVNGRLYTKLAFSEQRDRVTHFLDSFTFTDN